MAFAAALALAFPLALRAEEKAKGAEDKAMDCCARPGSAKAEHQKAHGESHKACEKGCTKHEHAAKGGAMKCTLTGKTVESCCCVEKDGKMRCTLADKDVEKCCCVPAGKEAAPAATTVS